MPPTQVRFFQEKPGDCPALDWLQGLLETDPDGFEKCMAVIERLREDGHALRRPTADFLQDGLLELRARRDRVRYPIIYFFHGRGVAVLAHALKKDQSAVPSADIRRALRRKRDFEADPRTHTHLE